MGLLEDLRARKLTGCRGCDAARRVLYQRLESIERAKRAAEAQARLLSENPPSPLSLLPFNTRARSPHGAFVESPHKAFDPCAVDVESVSPSSFSDGASVTISGKGFGTATSSVELNSAQDKSGTNVAQTVDSWSSTSIDITVVQGGLSAGTVYLFVDCQAVGTPVTLEAGDDWFFMTLGVAGINPEYSWALSVYEHGDVTADYGDPTYANIAGGWLEDEWPRTALQYHSDTSFDPSTLSLSCSTVSTPGGYTLTQYQPSGVVYPDSTPTTGTVLIRLTSDDALIRTFNGMTECDDHVYNPPPVLQEAWGYVP